MTTNEEAGGPPAELLDLIGNLAEFHREHEKFYSAAPLRDAVELEASSRVLKALASRWSEVEPQEESLPSPFAGAEDLNPPGLTAESGVLFMEGEGEPTEISRIKREIEQLACGVEEHRGLAGEGNGAVMAGRRRARRLPGPCRSTGERHQIIVNDWQAASLQKMIGRVLRRSLDLLSRLDFAPAAIRADLSGPRDTVPYLLSASELIDRAADLLAQSATLVHENERRWRTFAARVEEITRESAP